MRRAPLKTRVAVILAGLIVLNLGAWAWAALALGGRPALLGLALMVYGLGLRHAMDADHIAAIDNVTRKLMQAGDRPAGVGLFFALGHSSVVALVAFAVGVAATSIGRFRALQSAGGIVSEAISAGFLLSIAAMNIMIFASIWQTYRRVRNGAALNDETATQLLAQRGLLTRLLRPFFRLITRSWHMFPLGFLFGLGFDTATEVTMFGVSAAQAANGFPIGVVLVFPTLFAAGMSLIDTADGLLMLGAYRWAFVTPMRRLRYNMAITFVSIAAALFVGGVELAELLHDHAGWRTFHVQTVDLNRLGFVLVGLFGAAWLGSAAAGRLRATRRRAIGNAVVRGDTKCGSTALPLPR